jgi:hypothetical protein
LRRALTQVADGKVRTLLRHTHFDGNLRNVAQVKRRRTGGRILRNCSEGNGQGRCSEGNMLHSNRVDAAM